MLCCPRSSPSYNVTYDAQMELCNAPINSARQFFSSDLVTKAGVKSSCAWCDEAIRKVVSFDKCPTQTLRGTKHQSQSSRPRSSSRRSFFLWKLAKFRPVHKGIFLLERDQLPSLARPLARRGKGKKFWGHLASFCAACGRHIRVALESLVVS